MGTADIERLTQLAAERAAGLVLYARQWLDAADADDALQEALVALLGQRRPPDNAVAWLYRTVRNAAIDQARQATRRRRREQTVAATRREWFEGRPDSLLDARAAEETLRRLSAEHREIVVLRIWGELGFAEIAHVMKLSVSTVHDRYNSALRTMRSALEKPCRQETT